MKTRMLWFCVVASLALGPSAHAIDYTVEIPEPSFFPAVDASGARLARLSFTPGILATPPLLAPAIECNNFDTNFGYTGGSLFVPAGTSCAVGPDHVVTVTNVIVQWRPKVGTADLPEYENSLMGCFGTPPGVLADNPGFDPKVIYDQHHGRFVVVMLQQSDPAAGDPSEESRLLVAVSETSDPNQGWYMYVIDSKLSIAGTDHWADFPGLAVDDHAVYVTTNLFAFTSGSGGFGGSRLWIIDKVPAYSGGAIAYSVHDPFASAPVPAMTMQPTHMYGAAPDDALGRPVGTYLIGYSGLSNAGEEYVLVVEVSDPLGDAGGPYFSHQVVAVGDIDNTAAPVLDAPQPGSAATIDTNDRRTLNAMWRNNSLYACAQVRIPAGRPEAGETSAHWWRVNTQTPAPGLALADQGDVGGEDLAPGTYTYYSAVMADNNDNMAIAFSASAPTRAVGAYYATRLVGDPVGAIGPCAALAPGVDFYNRRFGGARNRWGEYSGLALCPADEITLYAFNAYAGPRGTVIPSLPTEDGRWHTKLGWFRITTTNSVAIARFDAVAQDGTVSIESEFRSDLRVEAVHLYRASGSGGFALIEVVLGGRERFDFMDRDVVPGKSYRYQLGVLDADGEVRSQVLTITVPTIHASLAQNAPNPFNPTTLIRYVLSGTGHVTLSVYDASGGLVRTLVDETRPAGKNDVAWDGRDGSGIPVGSGVYFYRIDAGTFSESRKMVLLK